VWIGPKQSRSPGRDFNPETPSTKQKCYPLGRVIQFSLFLLPYIAGLLSSFCDACRSVNTVAFHVKRDCFCHILFASIHCYRIFFHSAYSSRTSFVMCTLCWTCSWQWAYSSERTDFEPLRECKRIPRAYSSHLHAVTSFQMSRTLPPRSYTPSYHGNKYKDNVIFCVTLIIRHNAK
jgi:hypothetical protein